VKLTKEWIADRPVLALAIEMRFLTGQELLETALESVAQTGTSR
jgi:hypothetical protein